MTLKQLLDETSRRILRRDAETLLVHLAGRDRAWLLAHPETDLPPETLAHFDALVSRRQANEPLQYLTGRQEFFGMELHVTPDVLIPRPETELLVEAALGWIRQHVSAVHTGQDQGGALRIVDVGTGSGAIALALAKMLPDAEVWSVDLSEAALRVATANAERLALKSQVRFVQSDLLQSALPPQAASGSFDVVISNPPYVPAGDASALQPEVRDFEPHLALFAGDDGLEVYRRLIPQAWQALRHGGLLAMEFGFGQKESLAGLLAGWLDIRFLNDYAAIPRIVLANKP